MTKAVRVHRTGGPEVLTYEDVTVGAPGPGEARIRQTACGINFIDTYFRSGLYPAAGGTPFVVGSEAAGVVEAIGPGVTDLAPGDRVAYVVAIGGYAEARIIPADRLVKLPDGIDDAAAAGMMLKGMTAQYLVRRTYAVKPGDVVLVHAAAGGVGLLVCQWASHLGATVIGTVGDKAKADLAEANGARHVILYRDEDFVSRVNDITKGEKCHVVYDGVGKSTFPGSLDCLRPFGLFASFGNASGPIDAFPIALLMQKGSLYATRPSLFTHIAKRADLLAIAGDLFDVVGRGIVKIPVNQTYRLAEAERAHRELEGRGTTGTSVLIP